jgi:hypothetical protein
MMTPSVLVLILAAIGVLFLGGLVLSVVLLLNEKTRVIGIVLLALILLGVPATAVVVGVLVLTVRSSVQFDLQVDESRRLVPKPAEVTPMDEPKADEHADHADQPDPTEPIPAADQSQPEPPDTEPDADAQTGRLFPGSTHRRVNT